MENTIQEDTFEDAHDAAPETPTVRSLTERSPSNPRQSVPESETNSSTKEEPAEEPKKESLTVNAESESEDETEDKFEEVETSSLQQEDDVTLAQQNRPVVSPTQRISVTSNGQLDNVSLDDSNGSDAKGPLIKQ